MFMAAGFCMLEAGQVRSKNTAVICLKNIGLFSLAGLMYYLVGYNLMYDGVDGGYIGSFSIFDRSSDVDLETGYAAASDWYFQMVFVLSCIYRIRSISRKNFNLAILFVCCYPYSLYLSNCRFMAVGWRLVKKWIF